ncbi:MAG: type II toxin-antitoxin system prevent-host-death family antitoxin [Flavobacteriaceae bacterium]|nr:type II toxin-antitoxin system prevent-host-death family antitoxin [Flavobacteriaceae bacterium]MCI5087786.1 type II toxin-antitoxin system prevent-host-death family antitoxin [Flavobacteriaceae bacterium]
METTNATELRNKLKQKLDAVSKDRETIIIHRSKEEDVVMIPLSEYNSWKETLHLLSSPANRINLEKSMQELSEGHTQEVQISELWK